MLTPTQSDLTRINSLATRHALLGASIDLTFQVPIFMCFRVLMIHLSERVFACVPVADLSQVGWGRATCVLLVNPRDKRCGIEVIFLQLQLFIDRLLLVTRREDAG